MGNNNFKDLIIDNFNIATKVAKLCKIKGEKTEIKNERK